MKLGKWAIICGIAILLQSCIGPRSPRQVTIAFPDPNVESEGKLRQFQHILDTDQTHMVQNTRIEGLPEQIVRIEMEAARLKASGVQVAEVRTALSPNPMAPMHWLPGEDSLVLEIPVADLQGKMTMEDLGQVVIGSAADAPVVMLRDVANIRDSFRPHSIMVEGKPCAVIRGSTTADLKAVQDWLRGMDKQLDVKFFVVLAD